MFIKPLNCVVTGVLGKVPLQVILIVPFLLQIFGAVGLVGYFSFRNEQQVVSDLASQWQEELRDRIRQKLDTYLSQHFSRLERMLNNALKFTSFGRVSVRVVSGQWSVVSGQ